MNISIKSYQTSIPAKEPLIYSTKPGHSVSPRRLR